MAEKYLGIEKYIFADAYNFFLKYKDIPENDNMLWENCVADSRLLMFKYKNHPSARRIILDVLELIEFKVCNRVIDGYTYNQWDSTVGNYREAKPFSISSYENKI